MLNTKNENIEQKLASNILNEFLEIAMKHIYFEKNSYMSKKKERYSINIKNFLKEVEEKIIPNLLENDIDFNVFLEYLISMPIPNINFPITVQKEDLEKIKNEALEEVDFQTRHFWNSRPDKVETIVKEIQEEFLLAFEQGIESLKKFISNECIPSLSYLPYYLKDNLQINNKDEINNLKEVTKEFYLLIIKNLLINKKINPNFKLEDGNTFLHYIIEYIDQLDKILNFTELFMEHGFNPNIENNNGDTILHLSFKKVLLQCRNDMLTKEYYNHLIKMTNLVTDDKYDFQFTNDNSNNMIEDYFYSFNANGPKFDYRLHFFKCFPFLNCSIRNLKRTNLQFDDKIERLTFFLNALGECKVELDVDKFDINTDEKSNLRKSIKFKHNIIIKLEKETIELIKQLIGFPTLYSHVIEYSQVIDFILNGNVHNEFLPIYRNITNDSFASINQISLENFVISLWKEINDEIDMETSKFIGPTKPKKLIKINVKNLELEEN